MTQQSSSTPGARRPNRRVTRLMIVLGAAIVLALSVGAWWFLTRPTDAPVTGVAQTIQAGDLHITTHLDDAALGPRVIDILVRDTAGQLVDVETVRLRFTMAEMDMGQIEADAQPVGIGRYQARGAFFTMAGRWNVDAMLERANQPPIQATFAFPIAAPGEVSGPLNPLTPDEPTLAAGGLLYQENCVFCHGPSGKGDGPAALSLNPRPSDFNQHMSPGTHTDGQIFLWIRDGYPGTAMPAWGQRFGDEQIWQLVTFLRTFGQPAASSQASPVATVAPSGQSPSSIAATAAPTSEQPTPAPQAREPLPPLIFVRQGNLWRSDGSATPPRPITNLDAGSYAQYPALAPDGGQVALISTSQGPITDTTPLPLPIPITHLYVMNTDGSEPRLLWAPERGVLSAPAWSVDGQALYVSFADILSAPGAPVTERLFQILRVDVASGAQEVALPDARELIFSPDGSAVAYLRWHQNVAAFTLNIAAPDGSGERELTRRDLFPELYAPRFSPDGRQIIFISAGGPPTDEQGYPIRGSQLPLDRVMALFAPSVTEAHGAKLNLWVINIDGTGLRLLAALREDTPMAVFSPDGSQIAVMGAGGIYLLNADGSNLRIIDPLGDHGGLDWAR